MTHVFYFPPRPDLVIQQISGGLLSRSYSETLYEITSRHQLDAKAIALLSQAGLLGFGQAYDIVKSEVFAEAAPPVSVDARTGKPTGAPPVAANGQPITNTYDYTYHRYTIRRICDSGD